MLLEFIQSYQEFLQGEISKEKQAVISLVASGEIDKARISVGKVDGLEMASKELESSARTFIKENLNAS